MQRLKAAAHVLRYGDLPPLHPTDIPPISPEEVAEARVFFPREKFFIFGHARSGTTLLMRLVDLHPQVHCNRQAHFFTRPPLLHSLVADPRVAEWLRRKSVRWNRGRDLSPVVLRAAADFILERDARRTGASIVGDKSPNNLLHGRAVEWMHAIYPDARLVFIVRDGRDAALSHRIQAFIDRTHHLSPADLRLRSDFLRNPDAFRSPQKSLFTEDGIRREALSWATNVQETHSRGLQLYPERYHFLRFEDLLANPLAEMGRLWEFLGADPSAPGLERAIHDTLAVNQDARWQAQKVGESAQAIPKGAQGAWRDFFSLRDRHIFKQIAGETLIQWRYEHDLEW